MPGLVSGLVVDSWTEVVPDSNVATGLAVHFDAPSAKPPQVMLLTESPRGGTWSYAYTLSLVRQTLARVRMRAVEPDAIEGYGQYLPAVYFGSGVDPGPSETTAEIGTAKPETFAGVRP
jgi:hypothetical protein